MLDVIISKDKWDATVKSFIDWDVYYLYDYVYPLYLHGDGLPMLFFYEDSKCRICFVAMKSDISNYDKFKKLIKKNLFFDLETPYGYGGPLCDGNIDVSSQTDFCNELSSYCKDNSIVSIFIRFNPLTNNRFEITKNISSIYLHDTIYIDTSKIDLLLQNMDATNRNHIRKAVKKGVSIKNTDITNYHDFFILYSNTMKRNNAENYYFFDESYFDSLANMNRNAMIFYAYYEGKPIAGSIVLFNDKYMHYHLGGSDNDYRNIYATNLLFYEAACWGAKRGITKFHLGGGMQQNDSLFHFKKQFNKNGALNYYIGKMIFDQEKYDYSLKIRIKNDINFNQNSKIIQYRG